jgi:hypothetical protein
MCVYELFKIKFHLPVLLLLPLCAAVCDDGKELCEGEKSCCGFRFSFVKVVKEGMRCGELRVDVLMQFLCENAMSLSSSINCDHKS